MRNLKRALSLTLASVMLLGMMVVGSSAAGFPDVTEEDNVEAIEVLRAVEVMIGDDNGNFGPNDPVNRSQMAVVMAKLLNLDYQYYESSCIFWDVPTWARGYVGACYAKGIVSGYGSTTYGAADTVTAVQAASMMMRALGYFQNSEDYKGGFELATVSQGTEIGIFDGVGSSSTAPMTRNQVARMALNALESEMVTFTGTPGVTVGDVTVGYRAEYTPRTSTELKYKAIEDRTSDASLDSNHRGQYYIQLGEELYNGKLTKKYDTDDFERPSINWQYNGKEIGVYVDYDLLVAGGSYTTAVKYSELYNLLTFTTINDNSLYRYVDGIDQQEVRENFSRSNKDEVGGNGVLTEVFYNPQRDEIVITSINTYLAKANSDYNKNNETLSLKVFEKDGSGLTKIVDSEDVDKAESVAKDDFVLVYMSGKNNASKLEVVRIFDAEIMTDTQITKWSKADAPKVVKELTAGGTAYKTNPKAFYDRNGDVLLAYNEQRLTDTSYNIFMDRYGNVIGVDLYEGTKNYVFITGYDRISSNISVKTADAGAIFMDGTMDVITVNVTDTDKNIRNAKGNAENYVEWMHYNREGCRDLNRWYTYTVAANGNYTLKPVERSFYTSYNDTSDFDTKGTKVLNTANLYLNDSRPTTGNVYVNQGRIYGNDNSIYITVEPGYVDTSLPTGSHDAITDVKGVYTGAQDVKLEITTTSKELVNERKGEDHTTSVYPETSVDYSKVDYKVINNPSEQNAYVYSIYDSNYYIIASVVLGDAQGAAANYAYILGDAKSEWVEHGSDAKSSSDDTYFWEFEAVLNGEKQTLTVKSKYEDTIDDLRPYHVQELRFDGDYVTAIKEVDPDKVMGVNDNTSLKADDFDVYDVGHTTEAVAENTWSGSQNIHTDKNSTTHGSRYEYDYSDHRINGTIELVGRTLYTERPDDVGLALANNAKAVLIQKENKSIETIQCDSVNEAVGRLADADPDGEEGIQFHGRIVAVLDSAGAAKWVVIISDTLLTTGNRPNYGDNTGKVWMELIDGGEGTNSHYWKLHVPYSEDEYSVNPSSDKIAKWLAAAGCSEISKTRYGWDFVRNNVSHTDQAVKVVWCGEDHDDNANKEYKVTVSPASSVTLDRTSGLYKMGETVTVTVKPGENQTVKSVTTSNGDKVTKVNATTYTFTMPAKAVTVTVVFENNVPPVGGIAFTGTAVKDTDFTVVKNDGGSYTIKATESSSGLVVREGTGYTFAAVESTKVVDGVGIYKEWTVTPNEGISEITVYVNKTKFGVITVGGHVGFGTVEVLPEGGEARMSMARMARSAEAIGAIDYRKVTISGIDGMEGKTFLLGLAEINGVTAWWFGADVKAEDLKPLVDAMNEGTDFEVVVDEDAEITDEEKNEWNGGSDIPPAGEEVTLSLKGGLANESVKVYNGDPVVETTAVDTVNEEIYYTAKVTAGNTITLKNITAAAGTYLFTVDSKELPVTVKNGVITFVMPAANFTLNQDKDGKLVNGELVKVVTLKDGVEAGWSKTGDGEITALKTNQDNYVPNGAYITITGNGTGTKVVTEAFVAVPSQNPNNAQSPAPSNIFDADAENAESHGKQLQVSGKDVVLRSAIKVTLAAGDGTTAKTGSKTVITGKNSAWVALGETLSFDKGNNEKYTSYLVDKAVGDKMSLNQWTVAGEKDAKVYGAQKVTLNGVTAFAGENGKETIPVANGQYVAAGKYVKAEAVAANGTDVVKVEDNDTYIYTAKYASAAINDELTLSAAAKVTVNVGKLVKWGLAADECETNWTEPQAQDRTAEAPKVYYVRAGAYLKVDGAQGNTGDPVAYEGETVIGTSTTATDKTIVFPVGTKAIEVRMGEGPMGDKVAELLEAVRKVVAPNSVKGAIIRVEGNTMIAQGNLHYVGKTIGNETIEPAMKNTVAGDLSRFLNELHKAHDAVGVAAVNEIKFDGVLYTWNNQAQGGANKFQDAKGNTIIKAIVDATKSKLNKVGDTSTVTLEANGLVINFTVEVIGGDEPYAVESLINAVREAVAAKDRGVIEYKGTGNEIIAKGNMLYIGGSDATTAPSANNGASEQQQQAPAKTYTVDKDLSDFLKAMHKIYEAKTVYFNDTAYTWSDQVSNTNPYVNGQNSIIKAIVTSMADVDWENGTEQSIKLVVDDMEIVFTIVIDTSLDNPKGYEQNDG